MRYYVIALAGLALCVTASAVLAQGNMGPPADADNRAGAGGMPASSGAPRTFADNGAAQPNVALEVSPGQYETRAGFGPANLAGPDGWRYRWHEGRWWYWLPDGRWVFWNTDRWIDSVSGMSYGTAYTAGYASTYPPYSYGYVEPYSSAYGTPYHSGYRAGPSAYGSYYGPGFGWGHSAPSGGGGWGWSRWGR